VRLSLAARRAPVQGCPGQNLTFGRNRFRLAASATGTRGSTIGGLGEVYWEPENFGARDPLSLVEQYGVEMTYRL